MAAAALPGYCPVGYHLLYAALDGACFASRWEDDANPDGTCTGARRQTEPSDCHGFDTRAVLARAPTGAEVEVVVEGSELAVYVVGEADGGGRPVTYRVTARRGIGGAQSALSAVASVCVPDRIPLVGTIEEVFSPPASMPSDRDDRDDGVTVTLRLRAFLPAAIWSDGARLWAAENCRHRRDLCAAWAWTMSRLRGKGHAPGVAEAAGGDARPPDGPAGPGGVAGGGEGESETERRAAGLGGLFSGTVAENHLSIAAMFSSVPSPGAARRARTSAEREAAAAAAGPLFGEVPEEVLHRILSHLGTTRGGGGLGASGADDAPCGVGGDLARVAATCRLLRDVSREAAPGLACRLFPHQRDALRALVAREAGGCGKLVPHPALRRIVVQRADAQTPETTTATSSDVAAREQQGELVAWVLTVDVRDGGYFPGALHVGSRPTSMFSDVRGGVFADDPGLGKSVTALALVLRSRGLLPTPPPGVSEVKCGTPPSYVLPAPVGRQALERWWARVPTAATDEAEAADVEAHAAELETRRRSSEAAAAAAAAAQVRTEDKAACTDAGVARNDRYDAEIIRTTDAMIDGAMDRGAAPTLAAAAGSQPFDGQTFDPALGPEALVTTTNWISCDECGKWRRLPVSAALPPQGVAWYCQQHPDPALRSCSVPEEKADNDEWQQVAMGCYDVEAEQPGQERNILHFVECIRRLREDHDRDGRDWNGGNPVGGITARILLKWLARNRQNDALNPGGCGLILPPDMGYASQVLASYLLHYIPPGTETQPTKKRKSKTTPLKSNRGKKRLFSHELSGGDRFCKRGAERGPWGLPHNFRGSLRLDLEALEEAAEQFDDRELKAKRLHRVIGQKDVVEDPTKFGRGSRQRRKEGRGGGHLAARVGEGTASGDTPPQVITSRVAGGEASIGSPSTGVRTRGALAGGSVSPVLPSWNVRIFLSSATLVIVPDAALVEHWVCQIGIHVNRGDGDKERRLSEDEDEDEDDVPLAHWLKDDVPLADWLVQTPGTFLKTASAQSRLRCLARRPLRVLAVGGMSDKEAATLGQTHGGGRETPGVTRAWNFPPAEELARDYDLVICTFDRMSTSRTKDDDLLRVHFLRLIVDEGHLLGSVGSETSRVQRVRAVRAERRWIMTGTPAAVVQQSGGTVGQSVGHGGRKSSQAVCAAAAALHPLLDLIRAAPFGSSRALWHDAVIRPLQARRVEGSWILRRTLVHLMVRSSKAELGLLPPLTRRAVRVPFAATHAQSFNQLADLVRLNLLLADWNDPDHQESLLHPDRAVYARELYNNVRKACCVAGAVKIAPTEKDLCEMLTLICRRNGMEKPSAWDYDLDVDGQFVGGEGDGSSAGTILNHGGGIGGAAAGFTAGTHLGRNVATLSSTAFTIETKAFRGTSSTQVSGAGDERVRKTEGETGRRAGAHLPGGVLPGSHPPWLPRTHPLVHVEDAMRNGGPCGSCRSFTRISLAPPCGCCVLCPSCAERSPRRCAKCKEAYDMQAVDDPSRKHFNDNPKWPVPHELIEWQPAYVGFGAEGHRGGHWSVDWRSTDSSKVTWLIERLRTAGAAPPAPPTNHAPDVVRVFTAEGMAWTGAANGFARYATADDAVEANENYNLGEAVDSTAADGDRSDEQRDEEGRNMARAKADHSPEALPGWYATRKAVVYSAFWEHIQLIQMHLARHRVPFAVMLRHERAQDKAAELERFRFDSACGVLLMDNSGVVGLDLSFASLVIAMEPIPDASVLAQLEARAHRMGQQRPVEVEVLAMQGCAAEEAMLAPVDPELASELAEEATAKAAGGSNAWDDWVPGVKDDAVVSQWAGAEENVDAERARHKQCLSLVRAVSVAV